MARVASTDLHMSACVVLCGLFWLFIFQLSGRPIKQRFFCCCFFHICVCCVCVSATLRENVYCNVSVWCQLSWAASCLEKRMTVWLCDDNVSLASLFLSSVSLKNADIKCLMLACTTDVQIKTSPVRHVFFFISSCILTIHLLFPDLIQLYLFLLFKKFGLFYLVFFFLFPSLSRKLPELRSKNRKFTQGHIWL